MKFLKSGSQQKRFLLMLPVIVIPFITFIFWILGGGSDKSSNAATEKDFGLNLQVPDAGFKEDDKRDKLSFYELAEKDSQHLQGDPFTDSLLDSRKDLEHLASQYSETNTFSSPVAGIYGMNVSPGFGSKESADEKVLQKLNDINRVIGSANQQEKIVDNSLNEGRNSANDFGNDVDRLESMVKYMSGRSEEEDPEMKQLETTLDKILDIQHPDRVKEQLKKQSVEKKQSVFPVISRGSFARESLLNPGKPKTGNSFYSLDAEAEEEENQNSIAAVIHETQSLSDGSAVKFRLAQAVYIRGVMIPVGTVFYGEGSLSGDRLNVEIKNIRYQQNIFPVKLLLFDSDGMQGINIPNLVSRDVSKQSGENSMQMLELGMLDPSVKAQIASAGVNTAKNLIGRKIKQIRVTVKAGYLVLLHDKSIEE